MAQHVELAWALLCALAVSALLLILLLLRRRSRRHALEREAVPSQQRERGSAPVVRDSAALYGAVRDAEAKGNTDELPGLYLSLAHCRIEAGSTSDAEELLRKSIRGAGGPQHKEVHAQARLALGDLAHESGDLTTACEHWQIARGLFFELKRGREHEAVEMRMRRNGCPTDWVLTDF